MLNESKQTRVLSRMGARVLTQEEAERTGGGTFMSVMQTAHGGDLWIDQ